MNRVLSYCYKDIYTNEEIYVEEWFCSKSRMLKRMAEISNDESVYDISYRRFDILSEVM